MKKEKTYTGALNIGEKIVSIDTKYNWSAIEISMSQQIEIKSLLPDDYIVRSGRNKIIIVKFNTKEESFSELFEYRGFAKIKECIIVTKELESYKLYINNDSLQLWNTLSRTDEGSSSTHKVWESLGEKYEDLDFDGNNDKKYYTYRKQHYDKNSKTYTEVKEIRKK